MQSSDEARSGAKPANSAIDRRRFLKGSGVAIAGASVVHPTAAQEASPVATPQRMKTRQITPQSGSSIPLKRKRWTR